MAEVELPLDLVGMKSGQLLLMTYPQLPLAQGVAQEHKHYFAPSPRHTAHTDIIRNAKDDRCEHENR